MESWIIDYNVATRENRYRLFDKFDPSVSDGEDSGEDSDSSYYNGVGTACGCHSVAQIECVVNFVRNYDPKSSCPEKFYHIPGDLPVPGDPSVCERPPYASAIELAGTISENDRKSLINASTVEQTF